MKIGVATVVALAVWNVPAATAAQEVRTAIVPDSIHVGDIFRVAVRVLVPAGAAVTFPDTLDVPDNVEAAARRTMSVDTADDGRISHTAVYSLTAWRTGPVALPPALLMVTLPRGETEIEATFRPITIATLLPGDTAQIEPRPAKDVIGSSRLVWPIVLAAVVLLAALVLIVRAYRRRRPTMIAEPGVLPRHAALEELDRIRRLGYLERGELKPFYTAVASVLRRYTARLDPHWGAELTTTELWRSMQRALSDYAPAGTGSQPEHAGDGSNEAVELYSMLGRADLVKFAQARPAVAEAGAVWAEARQWVELFPPPPPSPEPGSGEEDK